jgi:hypothetical protein
MKKFSSARDAIAAESQRRASKAAILQSRKG